MGEEYLFSKIQIFSIIGSLILMTGLVVLIRRKKLREEYSILWLAIFTVFILTAIFGEFLIGLSKMLGIFYPPATLFLLLIIGLFLLTLHFSIIISDLKKKINELSIKLTLLDEKTRKDNREDCPVE